jgi:hypothetical protein
MIAKEKAKELVDKYFKGSDLLYHDLSWIQAKECATIAVDEIINEYNDFIQTHEQFLYWQQVKIEIENL